MKGVEYKNIKDGRVITFTPFMIETLKNNMSEWTIVKKDEIITDTDTVFKQINEQAELPYELVDLLQKKEPNEIRVKKIIKKIEGGKTNKQKNRV